MVTQLNSRRAYQISLSLFFISLLILVVWRRGQGSSLSYENFGRLPFNIQGWEGRKLPISERARRMLGTPNIIFRQYRKGARAVNLYILESAANRTSFHPPEYCYVGGRTEMVERGLRSVSWGQENVTAHRFVFAGPHGDSLVYYWYSFGSRFITSYYRQQMLIVFHQLIGRPRPALLVRLSLEGRFDPEAGDRIVEAFVREVFPTLTTLIFARQK